MVRQIPIAVLALGCTALVAAQPPLRVGQSMTSTTKAESHTKASVPDANGAVGPAHVVEFINGDVKMYDKKTGKLVLAQTSQIFWDAALGNTYGPNPDNKDPRLLFDPHSRRWYAVAQRPAEGDASLVVARSNSSDPTAGWKGVAFYVDEKRTPGVNADFDRLGFNADGIFITINQMTMTEKRPVPMGVAVFAIKKSDLDKPVPVLTLDRREQVKDSRDIVPVIDLDGRAHKATFWGVATGKLGANDVYVRSDLTIDPSGWTSDRTTVTVGDRPGQLLQRTAFPAVGIVQPGGTTVFTLFKQPTVAYLVNGEFWMAHTVALGEDRERTAIRWWRIRASDDMVLGEGVLSDPKVNVILPSLAVDSRGSVVLACVGASAAQPPSVYAIAGRVSGNSVTFDPAFTLVKEGLAASTAGGRWGDYTTTVADPSVAGSFWVFAPWAQANGEWATVIAELRLDQKKSM